MAARDEHSNTAIITGIFLVACGVFLALSILTSDTALYPQEESMDGLTGRIGAHAAYYANISLGALPGTLLSVLACLWGIHVALRQSFFNTWPQVAGGILLVASVSVLAASTGGEESSAFYGGITGNYLAPKGIAWMGYAGLYGVILLGLLAGSFLAFGQRLFSFFQFCSTLTEAGKNGILHAVEFLRSIFFRVTGTISDWREARRERAEEEEEYEEDEEEYYEEEEESEYEEEEEEEPVSKVKKVDLKKLAASASGRMSSAAKRKNTRAQAKESARRSRDRILARLKDYALPSGDLLETVDTSRGESQTTLQKRAEILERTLAEFKIDGRVVGIETGPRVTMFEISLAAGIRVERIFSLANNITMSLKAHNVRIVAPIPGKDTVGIEIPNMHTKLVGMREVYEDYDLKKNRMSAPMFLGSDITGAPIIEDLAKMPHLLIAGATGSGKSVCLNAIILSMLMTKRPDELKFILVDPKMVELSRFKNIPHLMCPVVTDMRRAAGILEWACSQMDQRYENLALLGVNNIDKFNSLGEKAITEAIANELTEDEQELFPKRLPHMIIVIDELADIMLVAGKEVEKSIIRLASKSRAVGIHVILATQRPSVDVITGLIKANMPCRIAFQVASKVDSRTILDGNGAENLLGAGDMLYMPPMSSKLIRSQGVFVTDAELASVVDFCRNQAAPDYHEELKGAVIEGMSSPGKAADRDELFDQSVRAVLESKRGSVSLLQRKLGIGYGRASRIIDQ
ncbi:MAG: DNA translocase FtsK 4TM domain-containing protein, partial [Planctomycetes bacterium]|nr:DNA translocase FtsK 4TM domain-containing protein [Planctomycetota bacterium]